MIAGDHLIDFPKVLTLCVNDKCYIVLERFIVSLSVGCFYICGLRLGDKILFLQVS